MIPLVIIIIIDIKNIQIYVFPLAINAYNFQYIQSVHCNLIHITYRIYGNNVRVY